VTYLAAFKQLKPCGDPPCILQYVTNEAVKDYMNETGKKYYEQEKIVIANDGGDDDDDDDDNPTVSKKGKEVVTTTEKSAVKRKKVVQKSTIALRAMLVNAHVAAAADGSTLNEELELDATVNAAASDAVNLLSEDIATGEQLKPDNTVNADASDAVVEGKDYEHKKRDDNDEDNDSDGDDDEDVNDVVNAKRDRKDDDLDDDDINKGEQVNDPTKTHQLMMLFWKKRT
ncbi:hypothetical protein LINPERPRIM_LOCUS6913, partial [Linum perenne]